jgi:hypothetical protein
MNIATELVTQVWRVIHRTPSPKSQSIHFIGEWGITVTEKECKYGCPIDHSQPSTGAAREKVGPPFNSSCLQSKGAPKRDSRNGDHSSEER